MLPEDTATVVRDAQARFESARSRIWLDKVRAGLEYRRAMREVEERVARARRERDLRIREAVGAGASYREVARALGLSHSRIQQIVNEGRASSGSRPVA
jgi:DNA invertase Pin-like site-specific DNA recombinase